MSKTEMKHKPAYTYIPIDAEELLKIGGNAAYADGIFLFDNLGGRSDDIMSETFLIKMIIKPKLDILVVCLGGELNYMLDSSRPICLQEGQIAYFRQDQIVEHKESHASAKIIMIAFPHEMAIGIREIDSEGLGLGAIRMTPPGKTMEDIQSIYSLMRSVFDDRELSYRKDIIHSYSRILIMQLADTVKGEREKSCEKPESGRPRREAILYNDFTSMVKEDYLHHRSVGHYASKLCVSPEHLSRIVKSVSGKSASEWIRDYVALEARVLLKSTDMTIYQISDTLNFPNPSFFTKFFRKSTGITPGAYRGIGS